MEPDLIDGKTILITGGAGFIGSSLVGRLITSNQVVVFDSFNRDSLSSKPYKDHKNLSVIEGDVRKIKDLSTAMKGADLVVHCAAIAGIDTVIKSPVNTMETNIMGSLNVLKAALNLDSCERVVCFSTSEVFGQSGFQSTERDNAIVGAVGEARWTYAASKLAEEHLANAFFLEYGLPTTSLRPFNVYGPGQVGEGAIHVFVKRALRGEPIEVHGDGSQIRAWCYVDDMVDATMLALTHPKAIGESFNIGNPRAVVTIFGLANTVARVLKSSSPIHFVDRTYVDVELRVPSVSKAKEILGFEAKVDLDEGILRTADFYRSLLHL